MISGLAYTHPVQGFRSAIFLNIIISFKHNNNIG